MQLLLNFFGMFWELFLCACKLPESFPVKFRIFEKNGCAGKWFICIVEMAV